MVRTALVTGGNRGIGLEVCRQLGVGGHRVVLTARDAVSGASAVADLRAAGIDARFEALDVADDRAAALCAHRLARDGVHVDVLVNNAAVYPQTGFFDTPPSLYRETFDIDFFGALWTCQTFVPAMLRAGFGRIVNVSSDYGSFADGLKGPAPYSLAKAALNALTLRLARELAGDVKVNAVHPGWVRTRMGGETAHRSIEHGAETVVWLATLPADGPNGGFFLDREPFPW